MEVNYTLIVVATIAQFILGGIWYSPLMFGKWWMQIMEVTHLSKEELQKLQKSMGPFYALQFILSLVTAYVLACAIAETSVGAYTVAFWIWLGFIVPTQISTVIWGNTKRKFWPKQLFVMLSMQFVGIMLAAFILSWW